MGEQSFAGAGRAAKKNIVTAGNGDGEGAFGGGLAVNIVKSKAIMLICFCIFNRNSCGSLWNFAFEKQSKFAQVMGGNNVDILSEQGGLLIVFGRNNELFDAVCLGNFDNTKDAFDGAYIAV